MSLFLVFIRTGDDSMPEYSYNGKKMDDKSVKGKIIARNSIDAYRQLKENKIFAYSIKNVEEEKHKMHRIKSVQLSDFSRQIGTMLEAGVSIMRALSMMKDRETNVKLRKIYENLYNLVNKGNTLSESMELCGVSFPDIMINIFRAGESSGKLDKSALKMAIYYEKEHKLNTKIKNAMIYPALLLIVTIFVVIGVFTVILPRFFELFQDIELPQITQVMINISDLLINYGFLLLIISIINVFILIKIFQIPSVKLKIDYKKIKVKKLGKLMSIVYTARFARTLSSLYSSGLVILDSVKLSSKVTGNKYIELQFPLVISKIRSGSSLSDAISKVDGFDPKLTSVIYIGEESGKLDEMLSTIADSLDYDAQTAMTRLLAILEPSMIVFMSVIIGGVIFSVMLPILSMYNNIH